jgi:hypothetical protein
MPRRAAGFHLEMRAGSPYYQAFFTLAGKGIRRSTGVLPPNEARARQEAAAIVAREAERLGQKPEGALAAAVGEHLDLRSLADLWIDQLTREHGKKHADRMDTDLLNYIEPRWKHPREITSEAWKRAKLELRERTTRLGRPLSWRSIAHVGNTLRHFLRFCADRGALETVPEIRLSTKEAKASRERTSPRVAFDGDQREAFLWALAVMNEGRALRVYTVLFETWMRKSSLEAMTPRWIDFKGERISIPAEHIKGGKAKVIDLTARAAEAIRGEIDEHDGPIKLEAPIFGHFDFHQAEDRGGGLFGRALAMAGIDRHGLTPHHSTRHTGLTLGGQQPGATLSGLMAQSGIDTATIVEVYLHPSLEAARRITRSRTVPGQ